MKICRFTAANSNDNRLGLVEGNDVLDVTAALDVLPACRYPLPAYDIMIENLDKVTARINAVKAGASKHALASVKLLPPVANYSKIINAPVNYKLHADEALTDKQLGAGAAGKTSMFIGDWGLFLKANSAMIGFGEEIKLRKGDRRNDHELELAVIIGKKCSKATVANAMDYVAAYSIGLDMTVRGQEDRSWRKSFDTYAPCGPWLVTKDEIPDPHNLNFSLTVNGEPRQKSNTSMLVFNIPKLIEYATECYTLYPGDIIFTGTPEGVGPVKPGDVLHIEFERIASCDVRIAKEYVS